MNAHNRFWDSDTYQIIKAMKSTGNLSGVIQSWKDAVANMIPHAAPRDQASLRAWLPLWQVRPFYTAAELAPMFPALTVAFGFRKTLSHVKSPKRLAVELDYGGLPRLMMLGGNTVYRNPITGERAVYYIVENIREWSSLYVSQEMFEKEFDRAYN